MDPQLAKWLSVTTQCLLGWFVLRSLAAIHGLLPISIWLLASAHLAVGVWLHVDPVRVNRLCPVGFAQSYLHWIGSWCSSTHSSVTAKHTLAEQLRVHSEAEFLTAAQRLKQIVWGHDDVIDSLVRCLHDQVRLRLGEVDGASPSLLASFQLVGATGIGKRYMATCLAHQLYRTPEMLVIRCSDESVESLLGSATESGRLISSLRIASARIVLWEDLDLASEELQRFVLGMMQRASVRGPGPSAAVCLAQTIFVFTIARAIPGIVAIRNQAANERQYHDQAVERLSSETVIAPDLLRRVTAIYACSSPDDMTKARVVANQLLQTCRSHGVQLNFVAPAILALEVLRITNERGFADVPLNAQRLLAKPLLAAKQDQRTQLSLHLDGNDQTCPKPNQERSSHAQ